MKLLAILCLLLLPLSAMAGEVRIVKCTDGSYAVQEELTLPGCGPEYSRCNSAGHCITLAVFCSGGHTEWRTLPAGCIPLAAAEMLYEEGLAWRNRPPAPTVLEPVEIIEP